MPVSLIIACLFINETNKSPNWLISEINKQKIRFERLSFKSKRLKFKTIINGTIDNIKDPIVPEIVLLGLIFDNFLPPIILPKI